MRIYDEIYEKNYTYETVPCECHGKQLFLQKITSKESNIKKNILCVHGLTITSSAFCSNYKDYNIAHKLCNIGYSVWIMDIGGHGRSETWEHGLDVNTQTGAEDIIAATEVIRKEEKVDRIELMGWSWGTMTCAVAATKKPELIQKLVLISPITGGTFPSKPREMFPDAYMPIQYKHCARLFPIKGLISGLEPEGDFEYDDNIVDLGLIDSSMHYMFRYLSEKGRPTGPSADIYCDADEWKIDAESIKAPTLMICGDNDLYVSQERLKVMYKKLPEGSKLKVIPKASHGFMFEKQNHVDGVQYILDFLQED